MIKDRKSLGKFNKEYYCKKVYSYRDCLRIFESLWQEAKDLGVLLPKNRLEGIESDLRIARALNPVKKRDKL